MEVQPDPRPARDHRRRNADLATAMGSGSIEARNLLVEENMALVHYVVRRVPMRPDEREDALAAGFMGLLRATEDYDPVRGASFSTYAFMWVRHAVLRHLKISRRRESVSSSTPLEALLAEVDTTGSVSLESFEPSSFDLVASSARGEDLVSASKDLRPVDREFLAVFFRNSGDEDLAAAELSLSIGAWRRGMDTVWSRLRHPAGPSLGLGQVSDLDLDKNRGSKNRWRMPPPVGSFALHGACRGLGVERFFPSRGESIAPASEVCNACPVKDDCRDFAVETPVLVGVWGATSEIERRKLRATSQG